MKLLLILLEVIIQKQTWIVNLITVGFIAQLMLLERLPHTGDLTETMYNRLFALFCTTGLGSFDF